MGHTRSHSLVTLRDLPIQEKTLLVRFDGDVPITNEKISDDFRLKAVLPTIHYSLEQHARIILLAHRGRPHGKPDPNLSNAILANYFGANLNEPVPLFTDLFASQTMARIQMMENLRFFPGEEKNDPKFARRLASLGDFYCNDAFADSHREHASVSALPGFLPHAAGFGFMQEIEQLTPLREDADSPYVTILGGAKAEDKSPILEDMIDHTDTILLGGLVAVTYLSAMGHPIGAHSVSRKQVTIAQHCIRKANEADITLHIPKDFVNQKREIKKVHQCNDNDLMLDIGPETLQEYDRVIHRANTIFWNGSMGKSEDIAFAKGTIRLAHSIGTSRAEVRIASGGDTVGAIHEHKLHKAFTFLSTGGGATLEFIAGRELPGIKALQ